MTRRKIIFELAQPGTWLVEPSPGQTSETESFISEAISSFYEMNAALWLFEDAQDTSIMKLQSNFRSEQWKADSRRRREIQVALEHQNGYSSEIYDQAALIFKREQWQRGELPRKIESAFSRLHAHAFLYAIDQIGKYLSVISDNATLSDAARAAARRFDTEFPQVREIRNSAAHKEDRLRGIGPRKQPIPRQPIDAYGISAPSGVTVMSGLHNQTLTYTTADGHLVGLDITLQTMQGVQVILQELLNALTWEGSPTHHPS